MTKYAVYYFEESSSWNQTSALVGDEVEQKNLFKYVVSVTQEYAEIEKDVRNKISCGCMKWGMVGGELCDRNIPLRLKVKLTDQWYDHQCCVG